METARQAHWVAALAIGCIRAGGDESVESGAAGRDVAQVLDLASRDATILRLAMRFVEEQATLEQPIRARTRTLLLLSLARVQDPDAPS